MGEEGEGETVEFDRNGGGHTLPYDYSQVSASKYKIKPHYNPLSTTLLDVTQQDSYSQLALSTLPSTSAEQSASLIDLADTASQGLTDANDFQFSFDELSDCSENDVLVVVKEPNCRRAKKEFTGSGLLWEWDGMDSLYTFYTSRDAE